MRATIRNYQAAVKRRREEGDDEAGFSLVELIVVVVILGILAAVAIPIFNGLQGQARKSAAEAAAANAVSQVAAQIASDQTVALPASTGDFTYAAGGTWAVTVKDVDKICITATHKDDAAATATKGPGC